ncbi:amidohydrolase 2 [Crucibulum laeve]|uniref:Amidohydrolase 2 n=1 Tax=Crucibulum laeve TaxID=68775 RepID=A0A5C3LX80_9AGAR|nr:amidohydrolase 2 [Crucibulum laeve]
MRLLAYSISFALSLASFSTLSNARKWHDSGTGTIIFEEAWTIPELLDQLGNKSAALGGTNAELRANLLDIHNQRLTLMNQNNVDFMVLSCSQPCIQGISNPTEAAQLAITVNNQLAVSIANNTERFGGFASLAMHNATVAAQELKRTVKELGFLGALINDYQQSGPDNSTLLFFDQPEYDVFWQMVTDLDVPVYFHPRSNIDQISNLLYRNAPFLLGPAQEFAATLSTHILGLCTNGVFDRFPKLKIIVGHLGERIPSDLVRIDEQLRRQLPLGMPMKKNVTFYWSTNLFETTSGNFATDLLQFHMKEIGLDQILYSVDYPYVDIAEGAVWVDGLNKTLNKKDLDSLKRGNAIKLLRLND